MANTYNSKNYFAHGGNELVVGGKLTFLDGAEVENFPGGGGGDSYTLPTASASTLGGVKVGSGLTITDGVLSADGVTPAAAQADSTATTIAALKDDTVTLTMGSLQNTIVIARWAIRSVENVALENDAEPQI